MRASRSSGAKGSPRETLPSSARRRGQGRRASDGLLELLMADFFLFAEDRRTVEELSATGAEVFRSRASGFVDPNDPRRVRADRE